MTPDEFRLELERFWERVVEDGDRAKDSQHALNELERCYERLDGTERGMAVRVFADWIFGADLRRRFAGLAMIDRFAIEAALPDLRRFAAELENDTGPAAPFDWAKVNRIIGRLTSVRNESGA